MSCVAGVRSRKDGHSRVEGEELTLSERQNVLLSCKTLTERAAQAQISPTKPSSRVRQVITNLFGNPIEFTRDSSQESLNDAKESDSTELSVLTPDLGSASLEGSWFRCLVPYVGGMEVLTSLRSYELIWDFPPSANSFYDHTDVMAK
ncbi:protein-histidine kinase [Moniliophthora roreri]|nr:protein-histidine kinase [Moniliophthora roreri]